MVEVAHEEVVAAGVALSADLGQQRGGSHARCCSRRARRSSAVGGDFLAHGVAQAVPEMPSVGDLDRLRQRLPHGLRIRGRAVPAHDLDSWMRPQPAGHDSGAAPSKYVDPGAGVGVDQHGGVVVPPAQCEVVDPQCPPHTARSGEGMPSKTRTAVSDGNPDLRQQ